MSSRTSILMLFLLLVAYLASAAAQDPTGCPASCGGGSNVTIEYPFGIGAAGCFRPGFEIKCNGSTPVLAGSTADVPLDDLNITSAEARVMLPVGWQCYNATSNDVDSGNWSDGGVQFNRDGVYRISNTHNQLVVVGCNSVGFSKSQRSEGGRYDYAFATGCMSYCNNSMSATDHACDGVGCCHVSIPPGITDNTMDFRTYDHRGMMDFSPCDYAFFVDWENYTFHRADLKMDRNRTMPVWLDWAIRDYPTCEEAKARPGYACVSNNSQCFNSPNGPGYICNCSTGYRGNPYLSGQGKGCEDVDECKEGDKCKGNECHNTIGNYTCSCRRGYYSADPYTQPCYHPFPLAAKISIGAGGALLIIALMVLVRLLGKEKRKLKQEKKLAKEFFEKNGGPILEKVNKIKLFKKEELNSILKNMHSLGEGGFGEVYKGHLLGDDSQEQPVAVKRPKKVNLADNQFANEVIIQSRVLHKNIVKLIGCCLEVDVPFLIYEFVTKGSLDDILHGRNKMSLNFIQRLQIAAQSAKGLAYLHSEIAEPIQHGDIKPANILLNDDLMPKISDFGISKLITKDKRYATTVIGDVSYVDPVYLQTGKLTNKSDVYSFGVVLLELITRKSASDPGNGNLIGNFHDAYTNERVIEFLDPEIAVEENIQLLHRLSEMIKQCLDLDVDQRPEMTLIEDCLRDMLKRAQATKMI